MNRYEFLVLSRAVDGRDDEFNRWYDRHLVDVLEIPGFVAARRFRMLTAAVRSGEAPRWQYAAIYEMECDDPSAVLAEIKLRAGTERMPISETLDRDHVATFLLSEIRRDPEC